MKCRVSLSGKDKEIIEWIYVLKIISQQSLPASSMNTYRKGKLEVGEDRKYGVADVRGAQR